MLTPMTPAQRVRMIDRHLPDDEAAPIVTDENRLLDPEHVEKTGKIAGQMRHVVGLRTSGGRVVPP